MVLTGDDTLGFAHDFASVVYRWQLLGFNAIRLPFRCAGRSVGPGGNCSASTPSAGPTAARDGGEGPGGSCSASTSSAGPSHHPHASVTSPCMATNKSLEGCSWEAPLLFLANRSSAFPAPLRLQTCHCAFFAPSLCLPCATAPSNVPLRLLCAFPMPS
eukprot:174693-Chlamydomonas_euryale.AAC.1